MAITLSGTYTAGYALTNPATQNPATLASGGYVTNTTSLHGGYAVYGTNAAAWNFTNFGTIKATFPASTGLFLKAGGTVTNGAAALIFGVNMGVYIAGKAGTVNNFGTIEGPDSDGIRVGNGGSVTNGTSGTGSALIVGLLNGVEVSGASGSTVTNYGTILGTGSEGEGVYLPVVADGNVSNARRRQRHRRLRRPDGLADRAA